MRLVLGHVGENLIMNITKNYIKKRRGSPLIYPNLQEKINMEETWDWTSANKRIRRQVKLTFKNCDDDNDDGGRINHNSDEDQPDEAGGGGGGGVCGGQGVTGGQEHQLAGGVGDGRTTGLGQEISTQELTYLIETNNKQDQRHTEDLEETFMHEGFLGQYI